MTRLPPLFILIIISVTFCFGQNANKPDDFTKTNNGELTMTFPGVYFKHNSIDYAMMPYSIDSCFKYIVAHIKDIKSFVIWRDSSETEKLTNERIKKLKTDISKYTPRKINIKSNGNAQKISGRTIAGGSSNEQIQYLLSLNSVFDTYTTLTLIERKGSHVDHPRIWCLSCWKKGRFTKEYRRMHVKNKRKEEKQKKTRRRLVWCGWRYGFHWSD